MRCSFARNAAGGAPPALLPPAPPPPAASSSSPSPASHPSPCCCCVPWGESEATTAAAASAEATSDSAPRTRRAAAELAASAASSSAVALKPQGGRSAQGGQRMLYVDHSGSLPQTPCIDACRSSSQGPLTLGATHFSSSRIKDLSTGTPAAAAAAALPRPASPAYCSRPLGVRRSASPCAWLLLARFKGESSARL
jgi:hypothetical protein